MLQYQFLDPNDILESTDFEFVVSFLKETGRTQIGWHYIVDLVWIYSLAKNWPAKFRVLDAGGGLGPAQFLLAELGLDVTNVDLVMASPPPRFSQRYNMTFTAATSHQDTPYVDHLKGASTSSRILAALRGTIRGNRWYQQAATRKYRQQHEAWRNGRGLTADIGSLAWMQANLCDVPEIATNSFDAVVSLSALEHIPISGLPAAWAEINRICKPDAAVAVTTSATERDATWFHEPSQGNCFAERDLDQIFGAQPTADNPPASSMLEAYRGCAYLQENLAGFYFKSGNNGMPWGQWDPTYIPVGLFKTR